MAGRRVLRTTGFLLATTSVAALMTVPSAVADPASASPMTRSLQIGLCWAPGSAESKKLAAMINRRLTAAVRVKRFSSVGFSLTDRTTGVACNYRGNWHTESASTVKATLVATLLWTRQRQHRALSRRERTWCRNAIRISDNASAAHLWDAVGRNPGVRKFLRAAKMRQTHPLVRQYWGNTQITAADQVRLMFVLHSSTSVLNRQSRRFETRLLRTVVASQRWGAPAGVGRDAVVENKNGWGPRRWRGWRINSVAYVTNPNHTYALAVLSDKNPNMTYGVHTIGRIARTANLALR
ncbi:MAG: serine hydrolase [Candidatus Nanopelagicales bacterium]|nr:serine hydrolase [Candidatus Nanopelagicales bacterium]